MPKKEIDSNSYLDNSGRMGSDSNDFNLKKMNNGKKGGSRFLLIIVVIIVIAGLVWWFFLRTPDTKETADSINTQQTTTTPNNAQVDMNDPNQSLLKLKEVAVVPENETPKIFSVTDAATTREQEPLLKDVENGDKVFVFSNKVYVLRGGVKVVIVADLPTSGSSTTTTNTSTTTTTPSTSTDTSTTKPATTEKPIVEVRNGTSTAGLGSKYQKTIQAGGFTVSSVGNSSVKGYTKVTIYNPGGKDITALSKLFTKPSIVTTLPSGEADIDSKADVLVIVAE